MTALLTTFLEDLAPYLLAGGAALIGAIGLWAHGRVSGAKAEKAKRDAERLAARTEADKIDQAVAGMTDAEVLKGQAKWSRPKS